MAAGEIFARAIQHARTHTVFYFVAQNVDDNSGGQQVQRRVH